MLFGSQSFSAAPFSSQYVQNATILANGNQINIAIGNVTTNIVTQVPVTGNKFNLATSTVSVISWNPIIPGATGVWIPIDPENP